MPSEKDREDERAGERPVEVTDENRPEGDPGADVDIQEYVGGQPGRPDPGVTGGPAHGDIGAHEDAGEPEAEPEAGDHVRAGLARGGQTAGSEPEPEAHRHAGVPSSTREEGTDLERQLREKTERAWPEREND